MRSRTQRSDIRVYNTTELSDLFDRVSAGPATSNRQTRALASQFAEKPSRPAPAVLSVEGVGSLVEWVLSTVGGRDRSIMQPAIRAVLRLENSGAASRCLVRLAPREPLGSSTL